MGKTSFILVCMYTIYLESVPRSIRENAAFLGDFLCKKLLDLETILSFIIVL